MNNEIKILAYIHQLVKENPNDQELGSKIRKLFEELNNPDDVNPPKPENTVD